MKGADQNDDFETGEDLWWKKHYKKMGWKWKQEEMLKQLEEKKKQQK